MTTKAPKDAILQALADESDQKIKMLLLLMLSAIEDIGGKAQFVCGIKPFGRFQR